MGIEQLHIVKLSCYSTDKWLLTLKILFNGFHIFTGTFVFFNRHPCELIVKGRIVIKKSWHEITCWKLEMKCSTSKNGTLHFDRKENISVSGWNETNKLILKCRNSLYIWCLNPELKWHFCHTPSDIFQILVQAKRTRTKWRNENEIVE